VTDDGTLTLLVAASGVSVLLAQVGRWSGRWHQAQRATQPSQGWRGFGPALRRGATRVGTLVGAFLASIALALGTALQWALAPVVRFLARVTAPTRGWISHTVWWFMLVKVFRQMSTVVAARSRTVALSTVRAVSALPGRGWVTLSATFLTLTLVAGGCVAIFAAGPPAQGLARAPSHVSPSGSGFSKLGRFIGGNSSAGSTKSANLPKATTTPSPAPPSLAGAAPLASHEVFGFAPYWTLPQSAGFSMSGLTTLAYFSIGINADGSFAESGAGWNGFQSQALADLVTRAHASNDRVVLTVNDFDQSSLDQLTSSATAPATLSSALIAAIESKNMDGVNLDFEGESSADQLGLTHLVTQVSLALHAVNPHWQVTMDTYASSAGDPSGFYNIKALAPWVDGFFVMAYQLNLQSPPSAASPLTSAMFSDLTTLQQYTAAAPASKIILGVPYFGVDWPTTDGTMAATAAGGATDIAYSQIVAAGHPVYWDSTTDTAWTSYQVGTQWHESYFDDPTSLYMVAQMAQLFHTGGVGIWALGMDGNDPNMLAALDGFAPAAKTGAPGPVATAPSTAVAPTVTTPSTTTTTTPPSPTTTTTTSPPTAATTTTTAPPKGSGGTTTTPTPLTYQATFDGQVVTLTKIDPQIFTNVVAITSAGTVTAFTTNDPTVSCLASANSLPVVQYANLPNDGVIEAATPDSCVTADFVFRMPTDTGNSVAPTTGNRVTAVASSSVGTKDDASS
jgi:Glycosyl hydrolases family 18